MEPLNVVLVGTPNGRAVQLLTNRDFYPAGAFAASSVSEISDYPLLESLLAHPAVESLYLAGNFCTLVLHPEAAQEAGALGAELRRVLLANWPASDRPELPLPNRFQAEVSPVAEYFRQHVLPATHQHGGGLYLVADNGNQLTLEALGACCGCPYAPETVEKGILVPMRRLRPDLVQVIVH